MTLSWRVNVAFDCSQPNKQINNFSSRHYRSHFKPAIVTTKKRMGWKKMLKHKIISLKAFYGFMIPNFLPRLFTFRYELLTVANQKQSKSLGDLLEMVSGLLIN